MTTTYTSYKLITADLATSLDRVAEQPDVKRESEYYLAKIGSVKSIDEFFADSRLYNYAMKAHGLEDMAYAKAFMRKVLELAPDVAGVCLANDTLALGAVEVVAAAGRIGEIVVTGFDAIPDAMISIHERRLSATIHQATRQIGADPVPLSSVDHQPRVASRRRISIASGWPKAPR